METKQNFAHRLKMLRTERGLSLAELAEALKTTPKGLSLYERGERTANIEMLTKIAQYFNVSTDYLVGLTNTRHPGKIVDLDKVPIDDILNAATRATGLDDNVFNYFTARHLLERDNFCSDIMNELFSHSDIVSNLFMLIYDLLVCSFVAEKQTDPAGKVQSTARADSTRYRLHFLFEKVLDIYDYRKNYSVLLLPYCSEELDLPAETLLDEYEKDGEPNGKHNPPGRIRQGS